MACNLTMVTCGTNHLPDSCTFFPMINPGSTYVSLCLTYYYRVHLDTIFASFNDSPATINHLQYTTRRMSIQDDSFSLCLKYQPPLCSNLAFELKNFYN